MARERVERRLAAILAADVAGYSRLVREDEEGTLAAVKSDIAEAFDPNVAAHNGRIFKTMGDGLLVEFASVVDAVRCAVEVQRAMADRNAARPDDGKVEFRIGVNLGDVIIEGDDLHGDGVNVSARLEGLADPGGIFISGTAFDQIHKNIDVGYEFLGEQEVKNIADPVRVYRVLTGPDDAGRLIGVTKKSPMSWKWPAMAASVILVLVVAGVAAWWPPWVARVEPASVERMAFALPEKPSIAVLPFDNLTGDAGQDIMIDGLVENIITSLSAIPKLFVISRNSSFTYKGKAVKVSQVAEELGVRYVLEGSVQLSGGKARITAQLIDAVAGNHLWAKRYDRELSDIFAVQDEISWEIATALEVKLLAGELAREQRETTTNSEAYALLLQGRKLFDENAFENALQSRRLYERALEHDPNFVAAMVETARTYLAVGKDMAEPSRSEAIAHAESYLEKARAIDESYAGIYSTTGQMLNMRGDYDQARRMFEKAVALEPNNTEILRRLAKSVGNRGQPEKAIPIIKEAMRLNPYYNAFYPRYLSVAYRRAGRLDEALDVAIGLLDYTPVYVGAHRELAVTYAIMGEMDKARTHAKLLLELKPDFTVQRWARSISDHLPEYRKRDLDALRAAGIPEGK